MPRSILDEAHIHPAIRDKLTQSQRDVVDEVQRAVAAHAVVVVGMRQSPFPKQARRALDAEDLTRLIDSSEIKSLLA